MKNKDKIKSIVNNLKIFNITGGIALGVPGMKLVESFREENFTSASISLLAISWAILGLHLVNKSFNEDIDKSMSAIYDDLSENDDKTNDFVKKKIVVESYNDSLFF